MGTAHIAFSKKLEVDQTSNSKNETTLEIGRIVFRSLVEAMERQDPSNLNWKGYLDAAYGMKYLYVGEKQRDDLFDFGPAFLKAVEKALRPASLKDISMESTGCILPSYT